VITNRDDPHSDVEPRAAGWRSAQECRATGYRGSAPYRLRPGPSPSFA